MEQVTTLAPAPVADYAQKMLATVERYAWNYREKKPTAPAFIPAPRVTSLKRAQRIEENLAWLLLDRKPNKRLLYKVRQARATVRVSRVLDMPLCNRGRFFDALATMPRPLALLDTRNVLRWAEMKQEAYQRIEEARTYRILFFLDLKIQAKYK